ncbi:BnaC06g05750D [Brassica napus]|uniref:BnaC06g05750D protein n=1 Tax=Brassica napus TaxID=3708 RepID=A0A078GLF8_BRANA|nr:BnaC06g05750D [Brassica napus]
MWISESTGTDPRTSEPTFTICCNHGKIKISPIRQPPALLEELLQSKKFRDTIRVYNSVLSFTSIGMKMDYSVVHNISSSRDHYETVGEEFAVKLVTDKGKGKEYDLPGTSEQLRDDHPSYMSLQYPLLFPYGEYGFHPEIPLHLQTGTSRTRQFLTIREFYAAQIQTRFNQGMTLIKSGRLLHQYIVDIYSAIEKDRLRFILPPSFTGGPRYGGESPNDRPDIESILDNIFVVPHNIDLLKKYEAHINVEWCNRTSAVKYLFKYITKGVDRATTVIEKGNTASTSDTTASGGSKEKVIKHRNEIQEYIDARYLSAWESMWRTSAFYIHKRKPSPGIEKTMFTEWMVLCRRSEFARTLTYVQIPEHFAWNNNTKVWSERKRGRAIGRIVAVHPSAGDRYNLRILINKIKGRRSYDELKTYNDVKYPDFKSVCYTRGYLDNDAEWLETLKTYGKTRGDR